MSEREEPNLHAEIAECSKALVAEERMKWKAAKEVASLHAENDALKARLKRLEKAPDVAYNEVGGGIVGECSGELQSGRSAFHAENALLKARIGRLENALREVLDNAICLSDAYARIERLEKALRQETIDIMGKTSDPYGWPMSRWKGIRLAVDNARATLYEGREKE